MSELTKSVTKRLTAAGLVYDAIYHEASAPEGLASAMEKNGLTLKDINIAMRLVRKDQYIALLEDSPEDKLANLMKSLLATGTSEEDAKVVVDSRREAMKSVGLPSGLSPALDEKGEQIKDTRGRKAAA